MLSQNDISYFTKRTNSVSIHYKEDTLSHDNLEYKENLDFKDLKCLSQEMIKNKNIMSALIGEKMLLQYPDSSSWSTTFHIEYVRLNSIMNNPNPETENSDVYWFKFKTMIEKPADFYEHLMYYHEPYTSFLNRRDSFGEHNPAYKMWVSEYIYNKLKKLVPHED
jgi:hypothetical protein